MTLSGINLTCIFQVLFTPSVSLSTAEAAVGATYITAVMPKSKPNTSRDFYKPRSSEGEEGAASGAETLSATGHLVRRFKSGSV